ncbi:hypothetical protein HDV02_003228 [Globomyces sp. JEL0801]|nr:hypothetical protein HDV02_003228 [Globomyces sp. JEL0801]
MEGRQRAAETGTNQTENGHSRSIPVSPPVQLPIDMRQNYGSFNNMGVSHRSIATSRQTSTPSMSWTSTSMFNHFRDRAPSLVVDPNDEEYGEALDNQNIEWQSDSVSHEQPAIRPPLIPQCVPIIENEEIIEESDPLLTTVILEEAKSSFAQSLFNSVNILMGIGLLSLPFAFNITGWAVGLVLLIIFGLITHHTGRLLEKCLNYRPPNGKCAQTYGDLGQNAFGTTGRTVISILFFLELIAASVALVILTSDSVVAIFPELDLITVKCVMVLLVFPTTLPKSLSIASYGSLVGIIALVNLLAVLFYDGLSNYSSPGSLWTPAETSLLPLDWYPVPLAFGLLMAGFSDMQKPEEYPALLNYTYVIVMTLYILIAAAGYTMFGIDTKEEVNI